MAKHHDIKGALDFMRQGYSDGTPFTFTVADIVGELDISEKKARDVLRAINTRARFWRGDFPAGGELVVSGPVYERITNWFD
ncbi:hypothetical protein BerOc1_02119 [Pseudodesulfovibrio hydrargyri]|uniref:Uncharacterized protein n=1 Tax=Pseudodesulfovibrio hydrargyri TaxID=2125990 RepID=A0A1J5MU84_9BACT|nr:hypothetical protein [Pseudodesulfovibrio hydrargyri]OIQ50189.1 hypothetical protein BerOc1_02119 [Pseudodesulfovibrio hydrargyri]